MKARKIMNRQETIYFINRELFNRDEGKAFTPEEIFEAVKRHAAENNLELESTAKQEVLAILMELNLHKAIKRDEDGNYYFKFAGK